MQQDNPNLIYSNDFEKSEKEKWQRFKEVVDPQLQSPHREELPSFIKKKKAEQTPEVTSARKASTIQTVSKFSCAENQESSE